MTMKTKSTRSATKPTVSRTKRRGESLADRASRLMEESAKEMAKVDGLLAKMSAKPKSHQYEDWAGECSRLMHESAIEIRLMGELLTKMEAQRMAH